MRRANAIVKRASAHPVRSGLCGRGPLCATTLRGPLRQIRGQGPRKADGFAGPFLCEGQRAFGDPPKPQGFRRPTRTPTHLIYLSSHMWQLRNPPSRRRFACSRGRRPPAGQVRVE